jgi:hypothetical protein
MTPLFITSLILGLLLGVRVMLFGVERPRDQHPSGERSFRLSPAVLVAFLIVFGITGYVVNRRADPPWPLLAALFVAGLFSVVTARLVTKWWKVVPEHDVDDERYVLQGQLARVVTAIDDRGVGEVEFQIDASRRVVSARSIGGEPLAVGTEVVIERVEADVAYVEAWSQVEQRL